MGMNGMRQSMGNQEVIKQFQSHQNNLIQNQWLKEEEEEEEEEEDASLQHSNSKNTTNNNNNNDEEVERQQEDLSVTTNTNTFIPICQNDYSITMSLPIMRNNIISQIISSGTFIHKNYLCFLKHKLFTNYKNYLSQQKLLINHNTYLDRIGISILLLQLSSILPRLYPSIVTLDNNNVVDSSSSAAGKKSHHSSSSSSSSLLPPPIIVKTTSAATSECQQQSKNDNNNNNNECSKEEATTRPTRTRYKQQNQQQQQ